MIPENSCRIVFTKDIYRKHDWVIPIEQKDGSYITGQELTRKQMLGQEPLTPEQKKKYPFIIVPTNYYKVKNLKNFDLNSEKDQALLGLILSTKQIASSKKDYDEKSMTFIGYIENFQEEAKNSNTHTDKELEALVHIKDLSSDARKELAIILNFRESDFNVNARIVSDELLRSKLNEYARKKPEAVLSTMDIYNPGVGNDKFIAMLLYHDLLKRKKDGGIYFLERFLGKTFKEVDERLNKSEYASIKDRLITELGKQKGEIPSDFNISKHVDLKEQIGADSKHIQYLTAKNEIFMAITSGDANRAKILLSDFIDNFRGKYTSDEVVDFKAKIDDMTKLSVIEESSKEDMNLSIDDGEEKTDVVGDQNDKISQDIEKAKYLEELKKMDLSKLHFRIKHANSPYNFDDVQNIKDNKAALIDYMMEVKFNT